MGLGRVAGGRENLVADVIQGGDVGDGEVPADLTHGGNVDHTVHEGGLVFLEEALDLRDFWVRGELGRARRGSEARVVARRRARCSRWPARPRAARHPGECRTRSGDHDHGFDPILAGEAEAPPELELAAPVDGGVQNVHDPRPAVRVTLRAGAGMELGGPPGRLVAIDEGGVGELLAHVLDAPAAQIVEIARRASRSSVSSASSHCGGVVGHLETGQPMGEGGIGGDVGEHPHGAGHGGLQVLDEGLAEPGGGVIEERAEEDVELRRCAGG